MISGYESEPELSVDQQYEYYLKLAEMGSMEGSCVNRSKKRDDSVRKSSQQKIGKYLRQDNVGK